MKKFLFFLPILTLFISCKSEDNPIQTSGDYHNGIFVTNEGPFQNGSGTVTFISNSGEVSQEIFKKANEKELGNIVQSMYLYENRAFIVVNNSHKIEVVNSFSFKELAVIEGDFIDNPRYFVAINDKGYISNWGNPQDPNDDFIAVINLADYRLITTIPVGEGPEKMLLKQNSLYVALQGGFGFNNKVVEIDTQSNSITQIFTVGDVPIGIEKDANGTLWILCQGIPSYASSLTETGGKLLKIENHQITATYSFASATTHPKNLSMDNGSIYFTIGNTIFKMSSSDTVLPENPIPAIFLNFYSLKVKDGKLYATDATDYISEGKLEIFNLDTASLLETYETGIIPGEIIFQYN